MENLRYNQQTVENILEIPKKLNPKIKSISIFNKTMKKILKKKHFEFDKEKFK